MKKRILSIHKNIWTGVRGDHQDGGRVRHGDHLPPHKYIRNTSTCGTTPTEHLLKAGRRPQTSQKAGNSPHTWVGHKKKEKNRDKRIGMGPVPLGGTCKGGKVSTHEEAPSLAEAGGGRGEASEPRRRAQQQGCRGQSGEIPTQRCRPALISPRGLAAHPLAGTGGGWELRLRLRRSDPRERTGVGGVNTA